MSSIEMMSRLNFCTKILVLSLLPVIFMTCRSYARDGTPSPAENRSSFGKNQEDPVHALPDPGGYLALGDRYLSENKELKALEAYEKYISSGGQSPEVWKKAGQLCLWNKLESKALVFLEGYLQQNGNDDEILKTVAEMYSWNGRLEQSLFWTRKYNARFSDPKMQILEARLLNWSGNQSQSLELYQKLLDSGGSPQKEDILREMLGILKYSDAVRASGIISKYTGQENKELDFFLKIMQIDIMLNLEYRSGASQLVDAAASSRLKTDRTHRFFADDTLYAAEQFFRAGRYDQSVKLLEDLEKGPGDLNQEQRRKLEFMNLRSVFLSSGKKEELEKIRQAALEKGSIRESAEYYLKQEKDDKKRFFFFLEYQGPYASEEIYQFTKGKYFFQEGPKKLAGRCLETLPDGMYREKLLFLMDTKNQVQHAEKILFEYDSYDDEAFKFLEKKLGSEQWKSTAAQIRQKRTEIESRNLEELRRKHAFFDLQESAVELAKNLSWSGKLQEGIDVLERFTRDHPDQELARAWLFQLRSAVPGYRADPERSREALGIFKSLNRDGLISDSDYADALIAAREYGSALQLVNRMAPSANTLRKKAGLLNQMKDYRQFSNTVLEFESKYGPDPDLQLQSAEIDIRRKNFASAKERLNKLPLDLESPSFEYFSGLKRQAEFYTRHRFIGSTSYFTDSESLKVLKRRIDMHYPLQHDQMKFGIDFPVITGKNNLQERLLSVSMDYILANEIRKITVSGNFHSLPEASLIRPGLEFIYRDRFWFRHGYQPVLDTPVAIRESLVKRTTGVEGKFVFQGNVGMDYRLNLLGYSDGNSGINQNLALVSNKFPAEQIRLAFEMDYLDHKITGNESYYSPEGLKSYSYGFNIQPKWYPAFISLRKTFSSDKNSGYSVYLAAPFKLNRWTLNLESSFSSSVSGRFSNARYKSKYIGASLYEEL